MSKALSKVNYYVLICSFLTFIFLFNFSFVSSLESSLEVSQWDKGNPSGNITNEYINNTYINQTLELNTTQFETGEPATIKTSWLTTFIESISKWANYYTKTEIDNRYSNNTGDQDLSTYVEGNMSAETYNETTITPTTNYSLSFDGSNDYISLQNKLQFPNGGRTFSFWIKTTQTSDGIILDDTQRSSPNMGTTCSVNGIVANKVSCHVFRGVSGSYLLVSSTSNVNTGNWVHVAFTWDGTTNTGAGKLYINGKLENSGTSPGISNGVSKYVMNFGRSEAGVAYFNGQIDEVLIFNRSLSAEEVSSLYNNGEGLYADTSFAPFNNGLVAGYHFDEGSGTTAYDITGKNNGTINGATWVDGKISHNLTETNEVLGAMGLMPWVSSTNFISTDYSLQWIGNTLKNPWFTSTELGNSTNRFNGWFWNTNSVNLNVTNQTTMNNLTVNNLNVTNGWSGNCVNSSILNGIIVGCND